MSLKLAYPLEGPVLLKTNNILGF